MLKNLFLSLFTTAVAVFYWGEEMKHSLLQVNFGCRFKDVNLKDGGLLNLRRIAHNIKRKECGITCHSRQPSG